MIAELCRKMAVHAGAAVGAGWEAEEKADVGVRVTATERAACNLLPRHVYIYVRERVATGAFNTDLLLGYQ